MRLWSIHPKYLDKIGLIALWRESLLAKKVLKNQTKGYKNHPQLIRFKKNKDKILMINTYLYYIQKEAENRKYNFDKTKLGRKTKKTILITNKQIEYEFEHLKKKLKKRDKNKYKEIKKIKKIKPHPLFNIKKGEIEKWEKI
ncbi:MAG: pyrimidine dimer DNA glycosylase/endonuclease V [Candidatus Micrarchaeia archaeon]|jgi:hypothetical protein